MCQLSGSPPKDVQTDNFNKTNMINFSPYYRGLGRSLQPAENVHSLRQTIYYNQGGFHYKHELIGQIGAELTRMDTD